MNSLARWSASAAALLVGSIGAGAIKDVREDTPLFTLQQAVHGKALYSVRCASCHGETLLGGSAPALAGADFASAWSADEQVADWAESQRTIDDLDFIIRTTMPKGSAGSLEPKEYTAILAYILEQNGYQPGPTPLHPGSPRMKQARLRFSSPKGVAVAAPPARIAGDPAAVPTGGGPAQTELNEAAGSTRDWLYHTHDYSGARYMALDDINATNARQLRPVCAFQLGDDSNFQTGPVVYRGTMYVTTRRSTVALDATTCRPKWRHKWTPLAREVWPSNRGVAIKDGYVVRGTSDGYLLALNAATGALVWAVYAADTRQGETFMMPPLIFEDLILIGPAGGENAISGWVGAFRLRDGSPVWKFRTVPGATLEGSASWANPHGIKLGGGAVWTPYSLDAGRAELFIAVTNPAPDLAANLRPGDNLYTNSVLALDVHTGKLLWFRQMVPNDSHDWDLTQVSPLFEGKVSGHDARLLVTAGKDGFVRTLDRDSHAVVYATAVTTIANADVPVTPEGVRVCPGALGGVEWNGPALDRELNVLYVNAVDWCETMASATNVRHVPGRDYMGGTDVMEKASRGWLTAINALTGAIVWKYESKRPMVAAVTATKGNVILTGELTGDFLAFDARDGKELYRFNTGGAIGAGIRGGSAF
jgi:alcohol dehydrogenase (cytochrome c)